ncbi:hypothetical protein mRhiFer1_008736 [Rhinolophus ferrumequinum]|uniref:E3 ubiquitin-protein ligase CHFR cysteine rich domain-containing protein n=1 Tax=Rhinolophus ferrumequinum TaxID=59479 RepID=A0A7J7TN48_RHIFE|nr:hypothetical protein mRhiFer1_008736 [Rhinolophus ferrumequinum]
MDAAYLYESLNEKPSVTQDSSEANKENVFLVTKDTSNQCDTHSALEDVGAVAVKLGTMGKTLTGILSQHLLYDWVVFLRRESSSEDLLELSDVDSESSDVNQLYIMCRQCPSTRDRCLDGQLSNNNYESDIIKNYLAARCLTWKNVLTKSLRALQRGVLLLSHYRNMEHRAAACEASKNRADLPVAAEHSCLHVASGCDILP